MNEGVDECIPGRGHCVMEQVTVGDWFLEIGDMMLLMKMKPPGSALVGLMMMVGGF